MLDQQTRKSRLCAVRPVEAASLTLSDGTVLSADIYRPEGETTHPVLLMRQPYGKAIASTVVLAHPIWYAARGYMVVIQDVRGTGASGGQFVPALNEASDGVETLDWARGLPGSNGRVGTYGFSYQGMTQFLTLAGGGQPDAMAVAMGSFCPETDWATEGGLFRAAAATGWAAQMARLAAIRAGDRAALAHLDPALGWSAHFTYLMTRPDLSHLKRWTVPGGAGHDPAAALAESVPTVPLLQVAGTADFMLRGALAADRAFRAVAPDSTHLIVAPWAHLPWNTDAASTAPNADAGLSVDRAQIAFFDHYLKGKGPAPAACVAFQVGTNTWAPCDPARTHTAPSSSVYLRSDGLAATLMTDGQLTIEPDDEGCDHLVHDPTRPARLIGGAAGQPFGEVDRSSLDARGDVACYTSAPLTDSFWLLGAARLTLRIDASGPHRGIAASLSRVTTTGQARVLSTAVAALSATTITVTFDLLSAQLHPGERLRLSVQAAPFPDYMLRPVRSLPDPEITPTTITLWHQGSVLCLPASGQDAPYA